MAGWQEELTVLLRELGVTQEESGTSLRSPHISGAEFATQETFIDQRVNRSRQPEYSSDTVLWGHREDDEEDDATAWMDDDLALMRHEIESIVKKISHMMRHDRSDIFLREDVLIVLRALYRDTSLAQYSRNDATYLESASALLHFCRLVLRLSEEDTRT